MALPRLAVTRVRDPGGDGSHARGTNGTQQKEIVMGQYYYPLILSESRDENGFEVVDFAFTSHDFGSGVKLMEHSWADNDFVHVVASFLNRPRRLAWAGDYADPEPGLTLTTEDGRAYEANLYDVASDAGNDTRPMLVLDGEPVMHTGEKWWDKRGAQYGIDKVNVEMTVEISSDARHRYFVNHDRGEFVDITHCEKSVTDWDPEGSVIHPLPLLTCEGNGRGGGDYHSYATTEGFEMVERVMPGQEFVGLWARDHIQATNTAPEGMAEIRPGFSENKSLIAAATLVALGTR